MLVFIFFWHFLVYCFVCHSEWSLDGFLNEAGTMDFAGGDVVHICSGVSGASISVFLPASFDGLCVLRRAMCHSVRRHLLLFCEPKSESAAGPIGAARDFAGRP